MQFNKTSNPAFSNYFFKDDNSASKKMTVRGILFKSLISILVIAAITVGIWKLYVNGTNVRWFTIGGMIAAIVISIVISVRQHWAHILVPLYVIAKGFFLGGITAYA